MLTNAKLQVVPAVTDTTSYFVEMQPITNGLTNSTFVNPNLTFTPNTNSLGLAGNFNLSGFFYPNNSSEKSQTPSIINTTLTVDLSNAAVFDVQLNSNITFINILNTQATGRASSFVLIFTADGTTRTVIWPGGFRWGSGAAPTITTTTGKKDVFVFFTVDGGNNWQAFIAGQSL
jgi:hypothetical protein